MEGIFLCFEEQLMVSETSENQLNVLMVISQIVGVNEYVVYVDNDKLVEILSENIIQKGWKNEWVLACLYGIS